MRSVTIRNLELSLAEVFGVITAVLILLIGTVLALQPVAPQVLSCAPGPPPIPTPQDTSGAPSSPQHTASLDNTTRDLHRTEQQLKNSSDTKLDNKLRQTAKARKTLLLDQMRTNPDKAVEQVLSDSDRTKAETVTRGCVETPVTIKGTLEVVHIDYNNHTDAETYTLTTPNHERLNLHPAHKSKIRLTSGLNLTVKGQKLDKDVLYDAAKPQDSSVTHSTAPWGSGVAEAATSDTTGPQQTLVLMVYFQDTTQPTTTQASVDSTIFTQMNNYYQETSYNQMSITGNSVNWLQIPMNRTCTDTYGVETAAINAAKASVNFANYTRIVIVGDYNNAQYDCGWQGMGTIGKTYVTTPNGQIHASVSWVDNKVLGVSTHEFGHNLGLWHAGFYNCGAVTLGTSGCTSDEYGDNFSPMGNGATVHMNTAEKDFLGWLGTGHTQTVTTSGTYTLEPLETTPTALKDIRIQRSNYDGLAYNYTYYEYRTPTGSDANLAANVFTGALLHNFTDTYTLLLDGTPPGDKTTPALPVGSSFTDPATTTKVTVTGKTASALTLNVAMGKTDFSTPTVSITSPTYDATVAGNTTITATASAPSGIQKVDFYLDNATTPTFTATTAPYKYTIDTTKLTDGYHTIDAQATDNSGQAYGVPGNQSGYDTVRVSVANDAIPPTVSLTAPASGSTVSGNAVTISANAADNVSVAKVEFYIDGVLKSTNTLAPFNYKWDTTTATDGSHSLTAKAYDPAGNVTTSSPVSVTVYNNTASDTLTSGQILNPGDQLKSSNGQYRVVMQTDGNLVVYSSTNRPLWNSATDGNPGSRTIMQTDGNLVVYSSTNRPLWNSATDGNPGSRTIMQTDGNLVVYTSATKPLWSWMSGRLLTAADTLTSGQILNPGDQLKSSNGQYRVVMQTDGNLVVYSSTNRPLWNSATDGNPGSRTIMQTDGNLVVYSSTNRPLWNSATDGNPGSRTIMQTDGNLVVYTSATKPLWSWMSGRL